MAAMPGTYGTAPATMQAAPVYAQYPVYGAPMPQVAPTYAAPGMIPTYAPTYAAPGSMPVATTVAEPMADDSVLTQGSAVETAVSTQTMPPRPRRSTGQTIMGPVTQIKIPVESVADPAKATMSMWNAQFQALQVDGEPQYLAGVGSEVNAAPQVMVQRQEQVVPGQVKQKITEIPTVQEIVEEQEVPEALLSAIVSLALG